MNPNQFVTLTQTVALTDPFYGEDVMSIKLGVNETENGYYTFVMYKDFLKLWSRRRDTDLSFIHTIEMDTGVIAKPHPKNKFLYTSPKIVVTSTKRFFDDEALCVDMLRSDASLIRYVLCEKQTESIKEAAIDPDGKIYDKNRNRYIVNDGSAIKYIYEPSDDIIKRAISMNGMNYLALHNSYKTKERLLSALKVTPGLILEIPEGDVSDDMMWEVVKSPQVNIDIITDASDHLNDDMRWDLLHRMFVDEFMYWGYIPNLTEDMLLWCIKTNSDELFYQYGLGYGVKKGNCDYDTFDIEPDDIFKLSHVHHTSCLTDKVRSEYIESYPKTISSMYGVSPHQVKQVNNNGVMNNLINNAQKVDLTGGVPRNSCTIS